MTQPRAQVVIDGEIGPLRQALREGAQAIKSFGSNATGSFAGAAGQAMAFKSNLAGIVATITSGAFTAFLKQQIDLQDEFSKAAQKAGVTTEQYSSMAYAAKLADLSTEDLTKAYAKLNVTLSDGLSGQKETVELFRRLKLDPKNVKDADEFLLLLAERFEAMEEGPKKAALAVDAFGEKLGPRLLPFLNAGRAGLEELREEAARLGVVVSTKAGREAEEFNDNLTRVSTAAKGAGMALANELLPDLAKGAEYFAKVTKEAGFLEGTLISIGALMAKGLGIDESGQVKSRISTLRGEAERLKLVLIGVENTLNRDPENQAAQRRFTTLTRKIEELREAAVKAEVELAKLSGAKDGRGAHGGGVNWGLIGQPKGFEPEQKKPTVPKEVKEAPSSYMQYYELLLAEEKRAQGLLDAGREFSRERELAYWRWLLENLQVTQADRVTILRKVAALEVDIARKSAADREALDAERARQAEAHALGKVDAERAAARMLLDQGAITNLQFLQLDADLEAKRYEIQRAALLARLELLANDPTSTPAERERLNGELLELDRQYQARRIEIMGGMAKGNGVRDMWSGISDSFGQAINGMLFQAQTWQQALWGIFRQVGQSFVNQVVTEPFTKWLVMQAKMLAAKLGFVSQENAIAAAGSAATVATKTAETTAVVGANAIQAGTGAAASQAPIPVVGPYLALAAMAAIFAAVSSFGKANKSAAGGYDIPAGINPIVQTHEEEMILPKQISNGFRELFAQGGVGQARGDTYHVNVQALDARSFHDYALDNADTFAAVARKNRRDNVRD